MSAICIDVTPASETPSFEFWSIHERSEMWWDAAEASWYNHGGRIENPCGESYVGPAHWMPNQDLYGGHGADFGGWVDQQTGGGLFTYPDEAFMIANGWPLDGSAPEGWPKCRVCGCWEYNACEGGCSWVEADLCSGCEGCEA